MCWDAKIIEVVCISVIYVLRKEQWFFANDLRTLREKQATLDVFQGKKQHLV